MTIEEWYRKSVKYSTGSMVCKSLTIAFMLVGLWPVWRIKNMKKVRVRLDPWMGPCDDSILSGLLVIALH